MAAAHGVMVGRICTLRKFYSSHLGSYLCRAGNILLGRISKYVRGSGVRRSVVNGLDAPSSAPVCRAPSRRDILRDAGALEGTRGKR